jgi:Protein of unknown function (DUF2612)
MASQETVDQLIEYYVNLLIIQYSGPGQPNAQATISLLANIMMATGVFFDVENAYNVIADLGPTAVGVQLDVIGKYVGVNRYYSAIDLIDYFAMVTYSEHSSLPTSPPAFGFGTYATFNNYDYNGTLTYDEILTSQNQLSDADFLTLILFMILCNNMNYSAYAIDSALWQIFGTKMHAESNGNMAMTFFIEGPITTLINTIIFKGLLPAPMGVQINIVQDITDLMFGMVNYSQVPGALYSPFAYGFSTYSDYATLPGQVLEYSQITEG